MQGPKDRIECKDGFSVSVQAGAFAYCLPRIDGAAFYTHYEVGYPSEEDEILSPYKESQHDEPTDCIYPYTPAGIIEQVIIKHGGLK